jgi:Protein of unknown function (DUF3592)
MISFIIIVTILVFNTVLFFLLKRNNHLFAFPVWVLIISVFVVMIGSILVNWQDNEINNELLKRNWATIEGVIIESEIVGERALRAEIKYKYNLKDTVYYGNSDYNIPGFGSKNYRRKNARIVKNENPAGRIITVYFNPENPEISTLRCGPYWSNYMIIGFGGVLLLIGMFIIEWRLFAKIKLKEK